MRIDLQSLYLSQCRATATHLMSESRYAGFTPTIAQLTADEFHPAANGEQLRLGAVVDRCSCLCKRYQTTRGWVESKVREVVFVGKGVKRSRTSIAKTPQEPPKL